MMIKIFCFGFLFSALVSDFYAKMLEGDIAQREDTNAFGSEIQHAFLWHNSTNWVHGTVPYYIDKDSITKKEDREMIKSVIDDIEAVATCITFKDLSGKAKIGDHLRIRAHGDLHNSGDGCWSYLGRQGGEQVVNLGEGCMNPGTIAHELLHALGQLHEHTRPDRDENVEILFDNIQPNKIGNFQKRKKGMGPDEVVHMDTSYDMYSLLHYNATAWSKDGSDTIRPINIQYKDIGGTDWMTATDIIELNLRYACSEIGTLLVVDYIHEVENRATMEIKNMADMFKDMSEKINSMKREIKDIKKKGKGIDNWMTLKTGTYAFWAKDHLNWYEARDKCKELGGHLVEIESQEEQDLIVKTIRDLGWAELKRNFFLGLNDISKEGAWVWDHSGRPMGDGYTNWIHGEPNDDDCAAAGQAFLWEGIRCDWKKMHGWTQGVVCERN